MVGGETGCLDGRDVGLLHGCFVGNAIGCTDGCVDGRD